MASAQAGSRGGGASSTGDLVAVQFPNSQGALLWPYACFRDLFSGAARCVSTSTCLPMASAEASSSGGGASDEGDSEGLGLTVSAIVWTRRVKSASCATAS